MSYINRHDQVWPQSTPQQPDRPLIDDFVPFVCLLVLLSVVVVAPLLYALEFAWNETGLYLDGLPQRPE